MKRYLSIMMVLCGFVFPHFACGAEWKVESGDTLWKILTEACQVAPSMEKARVFARAVRIQTPSLIFIGDRIDVSRGCAALSSSLSSSLENVVSISKAQGETLRVMQVKIEALKTEVAELRVKLNSLPGNNATDQVVVHQHQPEVRAEVAQQGTGAKVYHVFGDPAYFFKGWMALVAGFSLFILLSSLWKLWKRGRNREVASDVDSSQRESNMSEYFPDAESMQPSDITIIDHELQPLGISEDGFITLDVPFTMWMTHKLPMGIEDVRDIRVMSRWRVSPIDRGRGFETFDFDEDGCCLCANTLDSFRASTMKSLCLFLENLSTPRTTRKIISMMNRGLLQPIENPAYPSSEGKLDVEL